MTIHTKAWWICESMLLANTDITKPILLQDTWNLITFGHLVLHGSMLESRGSPCIQTTACTRRHFRSFIAGRCLKDISAAGHFPQTR